MPNGDDDGHDGALENHPSNSPLEPDVLLLHVDLALWKYVHPLAQMQLVNAGVDGGLKDASAAYTRNALAVHEEGRVAFSSEANVMGCQSPSDSL